MFREQINCLQHKAHTADLCCQVANTHWYCRLSKLSTSVSRDLSKSFWIVDWTGIDNPLGPNKYDAGSGNWVFIWVLNSFYCCLCGYFPLETKHKINVLWALWYLLVLVGGCGRTQCGNGKDCYTPYTVRRRKWYLPKFPCMYAACLNFGQCCANQTSGCLPLGILSTFISLARSSWGWRPFRVEERRTILVHTLAIFGDSTRFSSEHIFHLLALHSSSILTILV